MDTATREEISASVEAAMRSFEKAERALDVEALLSHFADVPDFHIYSDGERLSYQGMIANIRAGLPKLRAIEGGFGDIHVIVLAPDAALATAGFREAITDAEGVTTRVRGAASWLWRRIHERWRIVYGQADHYPDLASQTK
jgi:ketosteroid isomerase-like protein